MNVPLEKKSKQKGVKIHKKKIISHTQSQSKWKEIFLTPSMKRRSKRTSSRDLYNLPIHTSWISSVLTAPTSK